MDKGYVREAYVGGKKYAVYAVPDTLELKKYEAVEKMKGFAIYAQPYEEASRFEEEAAGVRFSKLPDEQSWMVFFPFDLLLGGKRRVIYTMDEVVRRLRGGISNVNCFYRGCRKPAKFFVEAPQGLFEGGSWYACGEEHFSPTTSKGVSVKNEDYRRL